MILSIVSPPKWILFVHLQTHQNPSSKGILPLLLLIFYAERVLNPGEHFVLSLLRFKSQRTSGVHSFHSPPLEVFDTSLSVGPVHSMHAYFSGNLYSYDYICTPCTHPGQFHVISSDILSLKTNLPSHSLHGYYALLTPVLQKRNN
jgi:hypothetical protein